MVVFDGNCAVGCGPGTDYPLNTYISMYARTNRCYNELGSRTNYVLAYPPVQPQFCSKYRNTGENCCNI